MNTMNNDENWGWPSRDPSCITIPNEYKDKIEGTECDELINEVQNGHLLFLHYMEVYMDGRWDLDEQTGWFIMDDYTEEEIINCIKPSEFRAGAHGWIISRPLF